MLNVTLEQARALDALAREGTFQRAAARLRKGHTAVVYAVRTLEAQTELTLLDRTAYRTRLTAVGQRVLEACRGLLDAERELATVCEEIKGGWEPYLRVVFDGVYPQDRILRAVGELARRAPVKIDVTVDFLSGVEARFLAEQADLMVSVLPPQASGLVAVPLPKLRAHLLAHRRHPLSRKRGRLGATDLAPHMLLTVHGSDPRLDLPTRELDRQSRVRLNDFSAKKAAIEAGLGFGWLPAHMVERELASGALRKLRWEGRSTHTLEPRLYHRADRPLGRGARYLLDELVGSQRRVKAPALA